MIFPFLLIFISVLLQTITTLPMALIGLLMSYIFYKESWIFFAAFFSGIFLDVITVRTLGESSLFFILFLFLIDLYEKKFEVQTLSFVCLASFLGSLVYLLLFGQSAAFQQAIVTTFLSILFFFITMRIGQKKSKTTFI